MKRVLAGCTALLVLFLSGCGDGGSTQACASLKAGDLVITEAMVDPAGTDTGNEWFEVYNTTGAAIDLKGLTLFASAADGTSAKTHVVRAGTAQPGGYFTFGDVRSGANPTWVGYSYNNSLGALPNANGAVGLKCGTTELAKFTWLAATASGHSLQLDATVNPSPERAAVAANYCPAPESLSPYSGTNYGTPGGENAICESVIISGAGKCVEGGVERDVVYPVAGDLVITEVMNHPSNGAANEWLELNARNSFDLNGLTISNTSGSSKTITGGACLPVNAGDYVVLASNADAGAAIGLPTPLFVYGTLSLADTGAQSLTVALPDGGVVDVANYNVPNAVTGRSQQLDPGSSDSVSNDDASHFCSGQTQWAGGDYGTPGAANEACPVVLPSDSCLDNGVARPINFPAPGTVVMTEVMGAPTSNADDEWVELLGTADFDLNGLTLTGTSGTARTVISDTCLPVAAGSHAVLSKVATPGSNLPFVNYAYGTLAITNTSAGSLTLTLPDGGLVDAINFAKPLSGKSWSLDSALLDTVSNDDPVSFCAAQTQWSGGDYGTPGAANPACPVAPDPTRCFDVGLDAGRPIVEPADGDLVITEWLTSPSTPQADREYVEALAKSDFDLNAVTLVVRGSSTGRLPLASTTCVPVTSGQYLVFARNADPLANGGLPPLAGALPTTSLTATVGLDLVRADGGVIDTVTVNGETSKRSVQVSLGSETAAENDDLSLRCTATLQWNPDAGSDFGSPGYANEPCPRAGACYDVSLPGYRDTVPPPDGDVVLTEWMSAPATPPGTAGEYFEVWAKSAFDLNGLSFAITNTSTLNFPFTSGAYCAPVAANTYLVVERNGDATVNGGLPPAAGTFGSASLQTSTTIAVYATDAGLLDAITIAGETQGASRQVKPDALNPIDNDDAGARCVTPAGNTYGPTANLGTPGAANVACP